MRNTGGVDDKHEGTLRPPTARQRAREQITGEILTAARERLRQDGPARLSLRAVARDVGMVSSAVYRYVSSRDELLTALLVDAYGELGRAAEQADESVTDRNDAAGRWFAACRAIREWALRHPSEYALLYGSPVPDYAAPQDTVEPASRVVTVLLRIVGAASSDDRACGDALDGASVGQIVPGAIDYARSRGVPLDPERAARLLEAWSGIFGAISFELFGHFVGSVADPEAFFARVVRRHASALGIA